jgi:hypothetical protein
MSTRLRDARPLLWHCVALYEPGRGSVRRNPLAVRPRTRFGALSHAADP